MRHGEIYWNGDGDEGLGQDTAAPAWTTWLQNVTSSVVDIGKNVASIEAMRQQAKTGQTPTAQVNVGVDPGLQRNLMVFGGIALAGIAAMMLLKKRR